MVGRYSPITAIRGETGAYPIYISMIIMMLKYWKRAEAFKDGESIVYDCMVEQRELCNKGKVCWTKQVKQFLKHFGLEKLSLNPEKVGY